MLQNQWRCLFSKFLFPSCMFVCFHVEAFFLGCLDMPILSTDLNINQAALWEHLTCSGCTFPYCQQGTAGAPVQYSTLAFSMLPIPMSDRKCKTSRLYTLKCCSWMATSMTKIRAGLPWKYPPIPDQIQVPFCLLYSAIQTTRGLPVSEKPQTARILLLHREELPADVIGKKSYKGREGGNTSHAPLSSSESLPSQKNLKPLKCWPMSLGQIKMVKMARYKAEILQNC